MIYRIQEQSCVTAQGGNSVLVDAANHAEALNKYLKSKIKDYPKAPPIGEFTTIIITPLGKPI
jgi:hypothetical protein